MPIYEIETDQGVFEIDADREPTQEEALNAISQTSEGPQLKPSTQQTLQEQESLRQGIIQQAQRSPLRKISDVGMAAGKAIIVDPLVAAAQGAISIPELINQSLQQASVAPIAATGAEAARRIGMDILQMGQSGIPAIAEFGTESLARSPMSPLSGAIQTIISRLRSRTPDEAEIQSQIQSIPLQQAMTEARTTVPSAASPLALGMEAAFEQANPQVSELLTQAGEIVVPVGKVSQSVKGAFKATSNVIKDAPRLLRSAIKPSNPKVGTKLETALENRFNDIYTSNPEAHVNSSTPYEGFVSSVESSLDDATRQLNDIRSAAGQSNESGKVLADSLRKHAERLKASGRKSVDIEALKTRASEVEGINTVTGLQDAVTEAGRKVDWNQPRTRAEEISDEIISREGGKELNKLFESVKGSEGATIRKKWGELKLIYDEASKRLNKIINQAPANARPALFEALSSTKGLAGTIGLLNGYSSGALALGVAGAETWLKRITKELKDPNAVINNLYEGISTNPPNLAPRIPPVIDAITPEFASSRFLSPQEQISQQIANQLQNQGSRIIPPPQIPLQEGFVGQPIAQRTSTGFNPQSGITGLTATEQEALSIAIAEQLSRSQRVPRIFLPAE